MPVTKYAFRFRRVRFETLDVVVENDPDATGNALAMIEAYRTAQGKRSTGTPDEEP